MFHYFSLEEVYAYAEKMGYSREDVVIEDRSYDDEVEYEVSFGHEYTEEWLWTFEALDGVAIEYDHIVWED